MVIALFFCFSGEGGTAEMSSDLDSPSTLVILKAVEEFPAVWDVRDVTSLTHLSYKGCLESLHFLAILENG